MSRRRTGLFVIFKNVFVLQLLLFFRNIDDTKNKLKICTVVSIWPGIGENTKMEKEMHLELLPNHLF